MLRTRPTSQRRLRSFLVLAAFLAWLMAAGLSTGCGTHIVPLPSQPAPCSGVLITGTLQDSLTLQPVAQAWVTHESAIPPEPLLPNTVTFQPAEQVATDASGAFRLCAAGFLQPSVLVLTALDAAGNAYPPFIAPVSGSVPSATDLGTVSMGGCRLTCGLATEQQTSAPANIGGAITSAPIEVTGVLLPQYDLLALDGSGQIWAVAIPSLTNSPPLTFATAATGCAAGVPFCASYQFVLPSQKPIWQVPAGYVQQLGPPVYLIDAAPAAPCTPPFSATAYQQDGTTPLTASAGTSITAADLRFTACH